MACRSSHPGDSLIKKCSSFCTEAKAAVHCGWCKCQSCGWCTGRASVGRNTPQPAQQQRRPEFGQLVRGAAVQDAVARLNNRWIGDEGLVVRLFECSMACTNTGVDAKGKPRGFASRKRGGVLLTKVHERKCLETELARRNRPASLLRWDLPLAVFNGGRCVNPASYERGTWPEETNVTDDGFITQGFVGHNVTAAGIGWVYGDVPKRKRGGAFGHDSWTFNFRREFNDKSGGSDSELDRCEVSRSGSSSTDYATARLAARRRPSSAYRPGSLQQIAAGYKWGFVNSSWNCYHSGKNWEGAFADQKAFALQLAEQHEETTLSGDCSIWGSLYNQIHVSWNASDLRAIFFVNDTLTARRAALQKRASANELALLEEGAETATLEAYSNALIAQRVMLNRTGLLVPVVQYTPTPECFDARPLAQRIRAEKAGESRGRLDVFQTPEPALRELSTLLDLSVNRPASKKSKKKKSKAATT